MELQQTARCVLSNAYFASHIWGSALPAEEIGQIRLIARAPADNSIMESVTPAKTAQQIARPAPGLTEPVLPARETESTPRSASVGKAPTLTQLVLIV
jgi:hypothetical protein